MAVSGTLYTYPENWRAFKALIAAQYSGARLRVLSTPPLFRFGHTNRSPEFLQKFPLGKVPAFEGDDGFCVFESNAIAYYVSTDELRGSTPEAAAAVLQWVNFADSDVVPPASTWVFPTLGILHYNKQVGSFSGNFGNFWGFFWGIFGVFLGFFVIFLKEFFGVFLSCFWMFPTLGILHYNKQATEVAKEEVRRVLGVLDGHLRTRTFLVGERVSLADISLVCALLWLYKQVLDPAFRGPFGNVTRWFLTCLNQPQFKAVLGEVQLCQRMAQFDAKKFAEGQARREKEKEPPRKGEKEKEPPKKGEKPPKREEKRPEPEQDLDECEQVLAAEPKAKDPFAHLPRSPFVLDEFKRKYSNEDTLGVALPHFWEHFDREGWSLWYCQYRYPEELSQTFMSCNLITGMFQRLDKLRKNAFASVVLFGKDHDSSISGVWVLRGQELAFTLCPDWQVDYESYTC
uniref:Eukaryotic translation elongation factor 1 gamma n=1 Tax=Taeniopygia guttata TaxID=59729 RepID=A0A674GQ05_TAEGU